jgi:hypothetical protein
MLYYQCDIAAYTKDAGGLPFLEQLFHYNNGKKVISNDNGFLQFSSSLNEKLIDLTTEIIQNGSNYSQGKPF